MSTKNVVILYGGHPDEAEVSKMSALSVLQGCVDNGLAPLMININSIELKPLLETIFEPLIINMVHGRWGEDGGAQSLFEELDIPYFGSSVYASEMTFDKAKFRSCMGELVRLPKGAFLTKEEYIATWDRFPHILKPHDSGSSVGVVYVERKEDVDLKNWFTPKIVEEYIGGIEGATVVYKGKCIGGVVLHYDGKLYDYNSKYSNSKTKKLEYWDCLEQETRDELTRFSETLYKECKCSGFLLIDFRLSKDGIPYIIEANTVPGMTKFSLVPYVFEQNKISFQELVLKMIEDARNSNRYHPFVSDDQENPAQAI